MTEKLRFYIDVQVPLAVTEGLSRRGIDVLTSQNDGTRTWPDAKLLDRATELGRVMISQDTDFLSEAADRQQKGQKFAGVIFVPQESVAIGKFVRDVEIIASVLTRDDMSQTVVYLPLPGD